MCANGQCETPRTCSELKLRSPAAPTGIYHVDVDGTGPELAFPVFCDMTFEGGGWTRVAYEPSASGGKLKQGGLAFLALQTLPQYVAEGTSTPGLIGAKFENPSLYRDLMVLWEPTGGAVFAHMTVTRPIFVNQSDPSMPVSNFVTNDERLRAWAVAAGGAVFCRASQVPDYIAPDTSWAIKPRDSVGTGCGCNDSIWKDRGAFYGGALPQSGCLPWGGGWAGVKDVNDQKGGLVSSEPVSLWIR